MRRNSTDCQIKIVAYSSWLVIFTGVGAIAGSFTGPWGTVIGAALGCGIYNLGVLCLMYYQRSRAVSTTSSAVSTSRYNLMCNPENKQYNQNNLGIGAVPVCS